MPTNATLLAVEPVEGMRSKFQSLYPNIKILNGSAEIMPVEDSSVDTLIAAQAFHWFNGFAALKEIHRVLKPNGNIGLIWNARDESLDWVSELTKVIDPHEGGAPRYKSMAWKRAFDDTNLFSKLQLQNFSYTPVGTVETIVDRIGSISFISALPEIEKQKVQTSAHTERRREMISLFQIASLSLQTQRLVAGQKVSPQCPRVCFRRGFRDAKESTLVEMPECGKFTSPYSP